MKRLILKPTKWIAGLAVAGLLSIAVVPRDDDYFEISKNLDIFGKVYREVNSFYVDDVDPAKFMRTGIDAMLGSLDPYTNFISASEIEDFKFMSTGQYGGIGALISKRDKEIMIADPYEGWPAAKNGLRAGDILVKVDNTTIEGKDMDTEAVRNLLRGQPGSSLSITVKRDDKLLEFTLTREEIKIHNVPYFGMVSKDVGYISLTGFTKGASDEVKHALENLKQNNPGIKGVILDVRGNPGGLLIEAIQISNLFVNKGVKIVETRGKMEGSEQSYYAENQPVDTQIPLVVLTNSRSASASEIVSGVIQDLDRGVIIGQRSFGKGLVQTTRPLSYNTQMKITTAKYYTPSGRCIQAIDYSHRNEDGSVGKIPDSLKKSFKTSAGRTVYDGGGIEPDIPVELPDMHTITRELVRQNLIFDFATVFRNKYEKIAPAREFVITDAMYVEFTDYVRTKNFKFDTQTEAQLKKLKEMLEKEKYYDDLKLEMTAIETKLNKEKEHDLEHFRMEISEVLKNEIVRRYYFDRGSIEASFDMDEDIKAALQVLQNPEEYKKLLTEK